MARSVGLALITAVATGCSDPGSTTRIVDQDVDSIAVTPTAWTLAVGESRQFSARAFDAAGTSIPNVGFVWNSTVASVASVSGSGLVEAISTGMATIEASAQGVTGSASGEVEIGGGSAGMSLSLSSYLGGSDFEQIRDIAMDAAGNTYIVGGTRSSDFPVTAGAYQTTHNPGTPEDASVDDFDVFVVKLNAAGSVVWSTYVGGPNYDRAYGVEADDQGYVYIAGRAGAGFPVTAGAFQTQFQGGEETAFYGHQDGFVCKLQPDGSALVFCSYFGSTDPRPVRDVAVDASGDIYLASGHLSGSYPPSVSSQFINGSAGSDDAVLAKISADGSTVLWARHLGGSGEERHQNSVRVGPGGDPYIVFTTHSAGLATAGSFDGTYGGNGDLFLAKVNGGTGAIMWGGYLGGSQVEEVETHELAVDSADNPVVAFQSTSNDVPTTSGAFSESSFGGQDVVVAKVSSDGGTLLGATYVGGNQVDGTQGVGVDRDGNIYFSGMTRSSDYPVTADAYQSSFQGGLQDMVAVVVAADFSSLLYATYLGGSDIDAGRTGFANGAGTFWVAGEASSQDWPLRNAAQPGFGGGTADGVIARFDW